MKIALVCDWLTNVGGAEKVLLALHRMYPKAPIYTSQYNPRKINWFSDADVRTGWLKVFPSCFRKFLGPLRQKYFAKLDLSEYDLVISVTGAEAKAVKAPNGIHISYCHVPTQYYWQMYDEYVKNPGFGIMNPLVRFFFKLFVRPMRKADYEAAQNVDYFVTISEYAKELIAKYYKREAIVIHPPVEVKDFSRKCLGGDFRDRKSSQMVVQAPYFITTSRQVNWKRIDLAVKACLKMKRELLVVGEGPEHQKLVRMTGNSEFVKFLPVQGREELVKLLTDAKAMIFPSLEPFGIAPVEALAAGCPVVAFGKGGALDYVMDGKNGVLFDRQNVSSLVGAIEKFEKMEFDKKYVSQSVEKFSVKRFETEIKKVINEKVKVH